MKLAELIQELERLKAQAQTSPWPESIDCDDHFAMALFYQSDTLIQCAKLVDDLANKNAYWVGRRSGWRCPFCANCARDWELMEDPARHQKYCLWRRAKELES